MKIALILKEEKIEDPTADTIPVIVLHTDNKSVIDVEKDFILRKDINYLALWVLTKNIKEIYLMNADTMVKKLFEKLGVTVRKYEEMKKNPLLKEFMADYI
ncbi:hypothetical protein GGR21_002942 [Dysgonomonas hofstadii]|uniref:Uncharacterized protein n=1 Tax=Dysgonomonas hofstadii TaxID=637886 RepID=A0A840CSB3_9BACT|nr:hypothetical protein [Dysgonomonas hofstadii]MBB4037028.1 hypothetical protein [Dysgonomonas hofstadii]